MITAILTDLLICKDSFQFISEITATFPLAQVGIMPSAAFGQELMEMTFTQDTYHINSLNLMVSTIKYSKSII
jgi:hypothetical protein